MNTAGASAATAASRPRLDRVLVVNTDPRLQGTIREALGNTAASEVRFVNPQDECRRVLKNRQAYSVVVIDASDTETAFSLMESIKEAWPEVCIVFLSNDMQFWMESIQRGAYDMLPIPLNGSDLAWIVQGAFSRHRAA